MSDNANQRLEKSIVALLLKAQDQVRACLRNDLKDAALSPNGKPLLEQDPSSVRVDLTVTATFSRLSDDDEPRASSMSVASDSNAVRLHLNLPTWLDELDR